MERRSRTVTIRLRKTNPIIPFTKQIFVSYINWRRRDTLKDTTLKQYHADLDRRLDRIMAAVPIGEPGRKLRKRIAANRSHLFVFVTNRGVPYTNNVSERNLRPSVIFRKVTNGFRCEWGAETYAAFRSVVSTAKANHASVLAVLQFVLATRLPLQTPAMAGRAITNWVIFIAGVYGPQWERASVHSAFNTFAHTSNLDLTAGLSGTRYNSQCTSFGMGKLFAHIFSSPNWDILSDFEVADRSRGLTQIWPAPRVIWPFARAHEIASEAHAHGRRSLYSRGFVR
jgi:hypothetical protein